LLRADFFAQVLFVCNVEVPAFEHGPGFINGANRELRLPWCPQFAHEHHIELAPECVGDYSSHRDRTAWHAQDERVLAFVRREPFG
jgi:hypothetical protein